MIFIIINYIRSFFISLNFLLIAGLNNSRHTAFIDKPVNTIISLISLQKLSGALKYSVLTGSFLKFLFNIVLF